MKKLLMTIVLMPMMAMALELSPSYSTEAVAKYKEIADSGDAEAQFLYARALVNGDGAKKNSSGAFDYAKRSAGQGFELSYRLVGVGHECGWGGISNATEAAVWYGKFLDWANPAAEQGDAWAQYQLGLCLEYGNGVAKDAKEAVKWYRKAAERESAPAQLRLGSCYENGNGIEKNFSEAMKWYRKAAEQGDVGAQCELALCCSDWYRNGMGREKSQEEGTKWFRRAADQGDVWAQTILGNCYKRGQGVEKSQNEAVKWYRKAADQGYHEAQCILGLYYMYGVGVEVNQAESVKWYRKAAEQDYFLGQSALGLCYANGWGVATNQVEAVKWYLKAAAHAWGAAQYQLVVCYANGDGVERDIKEAVKWYCKFAKNPHRPSDDPEKADEAYSGGLKCPMRTKAERLAKLQKTYDALAALGEEIKGLPSDVRAKYDKDLRDAKFRLDRARKRGLKDKSLAADKVGTEIRSFAQKLLECDFLVNEQFKRSAKVYLCFSPSSQSLVWSVFDGRGGLSRIAKIYAEKLKSEPDIEFIYFSNGRSDEEALTWMKKRDIGFPVVAPDGGNPLMPCELYSPRLSIVSADGAVLEDVSIGGADPFLAERLRELKVGAASELAHVLQHPSRFYPEQTASKTQKKGVEEVAMRLGDGGNVPGLQQGVFEKFANQFSRNFNAILKCGKTCADADRYSHAFGTILADVDYISREVRNEQMGSIEKFDDDAAVLYEGEIYLEGGKEYNFLVSVPDWASIEIDGEQILSGGSHEVMNGDRWQKGSRLIASKIYEKSGWHLIRVWMCYVVCEETLVLDRGIRWNAEGCKELNASTFSKWKTLRDDGSGCFLRSKPLPQAVRAKRQQLLALQEELRKVRQAKAAAAKSECASNCATSEATTKGAAANGCTNDSSKADGIALTGPYGIRMMADPGCEKGAVYVMKRLRDDYLPRATKYYGDPFQCGCTSRVYTIDVKRNDGKGRSKHTGPSGFFGFGRGYIGLAKDSDKYEFALDWLAASVLTVCEEPNSASFQQYVKRFVEGDVKGQDPVPQIKKDVQDGLAMEGADRRKKYPYMHTSMWAVFEELREKHPKFIQEYYQLKNSRFAEGCLPEKLSFDQVAGLLSEVTHENVTELFKKYGIGASSSKGPSADGASRVSDKAAQGKIVVAEKLQSCDFLLKKDFKKNAKFYLCLFSASWCGPCRREMPRIAKTYAETLKDDPDIELIHFSRDQNDEKALAWAKEHDVKFPVVKPNGGNPLDLHSRGIPHLFIVKDDGTLLEEGHPMRLFTDEKLRALKDR